MLPYLSGDMKYGAQEVRNLLKGLGIWALFKPLGGKEKVEIKNERWVKKKLKERNRIKRSFGIGRQHYGLDLAKSNYPFIKSFSDPKDLVASNDIDTVAVVTPVFTHYELGPVLFKNTA